MIGMSFSCIVVAGGDGWQRTVGCINITCYYLIKIPFGIMVEYIFKFQIEVSDLSHI